MRYYAFFISTDDRTIRFKKPGSINISISPQAFTIHGYTKIPIRSITSLTIQHTVSDTALSAGKALGGAIVAGGVGMVVGAAMGGKKVTSVLAITYMNEIGQECTSMIESSNGYRIKEAYDRYSGTESASSAAMQRTQTSNRMRRGLIIYFTWPYRLLKKFTRK